MTEMDWTSPLGERMMRPETLFESHLTHQGRREEQEALRRRDEFAEQRRRDDIAVEERRELAICLRAVVGRLDKFEPAILGNKELGQRSLGERLESVERVILSARVGWRTATFIGTAVFGLVSAFAYLLHLAPVLLGAGPPSSR